MTAQGSVIAALRATLSRQERGDATEDVLPLGVEAIDSVLPGGGLPMGALHEVAAPAGDAAAMGFVLALAARRQALDRAADRPLAVLLWCQSGAAEHEMGRLYGPGLAQLGVETRRLVLVRPAKLRDLLWSMEEGLRSGVVPIVVGVGVEADLVASRRLHLAAASTGALAFLLPPLRPKPPPSPAFTRWQVRAASPAERAGLPRGRAGALPGWHVSLQRCRNGAPAPEGWSLAWNAREGHFLLGKFPQKENA